RGLEKCGDMSRSNSPSVVIDANVLIAICTQEQNKYSKAKAALEDYAANGFMFFAPNVIIYESLYVICNKLQNSLITAADYEKAIQNLIDQLQAIIPPPNGEVILIQRGKEIRDGYGCSRSSDSLHIALAEELTQHGPTELLTFDQDLIKQAAKNA